MYGDSDFGEIVNGRGLLPVYSLVVFSVIKSVENFIACELLVVLEVFGTGAGREMGHNDR